ncbi:MAG: SIMPL domain-containing protein [Patescibacteria group bacterium]
MEKTKHYLNVAIIVMLLAGAYSVWIYSSAYANSQPTSFRSFSVSGEGKTVVVPDVAEFNFSVTTEGGKDLGALQTENTTKMNKAIDFVKSKGIEAKDIKTQNYNISPRYQNYSCSVYQQYQAERGEAKPCPPAEIVGYTISQNVDVKVRDFSSIGDILGGIVASGANTVSQLQFTIDDPDSARADARAEAIDKAKAKAKELAKAGSFGIGRLLEIYENSATPVSYAYGMGGESMMKNADASIAPAIEAGSEDVKVNVTSRYEIR